MKLILNMFKNNRCYKASQPMQAPKGIMWHSTATPGATPEDFALSWNSKDFTRGVLVHAFVDNEKVMQVLEYNKKCWGCGGTGNSTHIQFELCEPPGFEYVNGAIVGYDVAKNKAYFDAVYKNALEYTYALCKKFNLSVDTVIDHSEGHAKGIASNHGDVAHWFKLHGKSMDTVRSDLRKMMLVNSAPQIKTGSNVKVKQGAKTYNGGNVSAFVYKGVYRVDTLSKDRAVLDSNGICTAFNIKDLTLA